MSSSRASSFRVALLANLALATASCGVFGAAGDAPEPGPTEQLPARGEGVVDPPAPPVVGGPASQSELTDAFGVFVAPTGADTANGTAAKPLLTIAAGIAKGKREGKRVYVCTGTYAESLTLANTISIIGGLWCDNGDWRVGAPRTRLEAPTSPAVRAAGINLSTRLEGLEIVAPNATTPSGSSIALIADGSPALVIARSRLVAGDGAKGDDGTEGTQLVNAASATGSASSGAVQCVEGSTCSKGFQTFWLIYPAPGGGINVCDGAPGHIAESGGKGGQGGLWQVGQNVGFYFELYRKNAIYDVDNSGKTLTSAAGADAADGSNGPALGALSADGYAPGDGITGADGSPGKGGNGGYGGSASETVDANSVSADSVWRGYRGAGGGAGGCPGVVGTAGKGGGASIAALLVNGAVTFDTSELVAGRGGDGGAGTFGSLPTAGGQPGLVVVSTSVQAGKPGGRGGAAGISGNGGSGPSLGVAHIGESSKPTLSADTKIIPGTGGAALPVRTRTDGFQITKTIPATPAGTVADVLAL